MFARLVASSLRPRGAGGWRCRCSRSRSGSRCRPTLATLALQVGDDLARTLRASGPNFVVLPAGARLVCRARRRRSVSRRSPASRCPTRWSRVSSESFWKNNLLEAAPELTTSGRDRRPRRRRSPAPGSSATSPPPTARRGTPASPGCTRHWTLEGRWPSDGADELVARPRARARASTGTPARTSAWTPPTPSGTGSSPACSPPAARDDDRAWTPLARAQAIAGRAGEVDRVWLSALVQTVAAHAAARSGTRSRRATSAIAAPRYPDNVARDLAAAARRRRGAAADARWCAGEARGGQPAQHAHAAAGARRRSPRRCSGCVVDQRPRRWSSARVELGLLRALGATRRARSRALLVGETVAGLARGRTAGLPARRRRRRRRSAAMPSAPPPSSRRCCCRSRSCCRSCSPSPARSGRCASRSGTDPAQVLRG